MSLQLYLLSVHLSRGDTMDATTSATVGWVALAYICLDTYMPVVVYEEDGISIRDHCRAEPPGNIEPAGLVPTVGGRDRASASYDAADRVEAPARAARGGFR